MRPKVSEESLLVDGIGNSKANPKPWNMEQNKEKIRHILQYYYDRGKNASQAANKICAVYGPNTVSISTAQRWFQRFRSGVEVVEDAPRSVRPVVENCDKIAELVERDRHSSSRSIGQELGMSNQTVINHLKKSLRSSMYGCHTN